MEARCFRRPGWGQVLPRHCGEGGRGTSDECAASLSCAAPSVAWGLGSEGKGQRAAREGRINARIVAIRKGKKPLWAHSDMTLKAEDKFWDEKEVREVDFTVGLPDLAN